MSLLRLAVSLLACAAPMIAAGCHAPPTPPPAAAKAATDDTSDSSPGAGYAMASLDKDGDGHVSLLEMREAAGRKFRDLDRDNSGKVDIARECKARFTSFCKKADKNGDGQIDRAEFIAHAEEHFRLADADNDGKLTRQEMTGVTIFRW